MTEKLSYEPIPMFSVYANDGTQHLGAVVQLAPGRWCPYGEEHLVFRTRAQAAGFLLGRIREIEKAKREGYDLTV